MQIVPPIEMAEQTAVDAIYYIHYRVSLLDFASEN